MTREEAAIALGAALGWDVIRDIGGRFSGWGIGPKEIVEQDGFIRRYERWPQNVSLPAPDAPLHEHLAFVGRVAEALGTGVQMGYCPKARAAWVGLDERVRSSEAPDPSWAAMLAAIEARKGR